MSTLLGDVAAAVGVPLAQLGGALERIERLCGSELAGDAAQLRRAAVAWREEAARLSELESELERQVQSTLADTWQGQASQAFAGIWGSLAAKLQELATGYERGATSLEQEAARATDLNQQVAWLAEEIQRLLAPLHSVQELGTAVGLTGQAGAVVTSSAAEFRV